MNLDGSDHEWLSLCPEERQVLLLVIDDATGKNLAGCLVEAETTRGCMYIMRQVVERYGHHNFIQTGTVCFLGRYDAEGKPVDINSDKRGTSSNSPVPNLSIKNYQTGHFSCYENQTF